MSAAADRLRGLVSDYYHGLLTFESYREQRGKLLDTLEIGPNKPSNVAAKEAPAAKVAPVRPASPAPRPPTAPVSVARAPEPAPRRSGRTAAVTGAAAVAIAAAGFVGYRLLRPGTETGEPAAAAATLPPGAAQLEQFIERGVWATDSVRTLEITWNNVLTEEQREAARASPTFTRFADVLRRRLRAEEALSGPEPSAELESLVSLARTLQMPYADSLDLPVRGPAQAATSPAPAADREEVADPVPPSIAGAESASTTEARDEPQATESGDEPVVPAPPAASATITSTPPAVTNAGPVASTPTPNAQTTSEPIRTGGSPACSAELLNTRIRSCRDPLRAGGEAPQLVIIPAGMFRMGSDQRNEGPQHEVVLAGAFALSVYEVSFADFDAYCEAAEVRCPDNPWGAADYPVVLVSWNEAVAYTDWLTAQTGHRYRLPSEAEWEYAARAGTDTPYPFGDVIKLTPVAARSSHNGAVDSPVPNSDGSVNRNAFRLLHMIGNVREWVADGWQDNFEGAPTDGSARAGSESTPRVVRGGAYADGARPLRSAARLALDPGTTDRLTGFRVVRELGD